MTVARTEADMDCSIDFFFSLFPTLYSRFYLYR